MTHSLNPLGQVELDIIKLTGQGLNPGESQTIICPFCENDWQKQGKPSAWLPEKSCSVTRSSGRSLYKCHRASCHRGNPGGAVFDGGAQVQTSVNQVETKSPARSKIRPYSGKLEEVPGNIYEEMIEPFEITKVQVIQQAWKWAPQERALAMPIYNNVGLRLGLTLKRCKAARKVGKPHVFSYPEVDNEPLVHFPRRPKGVSIIKPKMPTFMVEDQIAATKIAMVGQALAILGSSVSGDAMGTIVAAQVKRLMVYLDPDAWAAAQNIVKRYDGLFEEIRAIRPGTEPKEKLLSFYENLTRIKEHQPLNGVNAQQAV